MKTNMKNEIKQVLSGETVDGVRVIWDRQDPNNHGAFARYDDGRADEPLEFAGWSHCGDEYYPANVADYFDHDGLYLGPDCDGIYPLFSLTGWKS